MNDNHSTRELDPTLADAAPQPLSWLNALVRLWCLRPVRAAPRGPVAAPIMLLSFAWLAAWVLIDRWQRQPDPEFFIDGIPMLGWYGLGVLSLAGLLNWVSTPRSAFGATLFLALGLTPLPLLLVSVGAYFFKAPWFGWTSGALGIYAIVYLSRGLRAVTGRPQRAAALIGVLFVAAFIWVSDAVDAIPDVWNPRDADQSVSEDVLADREAALFEQASRIDEALDAVHRETSPRPEAFFLGFAGVGEEKVFAQEIELASHALADRFAIGNRQVSLLNDERDLGEAPLASVSGLTYALQGLASRMNLDKDVLFLAISSHGSDEPAIAVSNSQFPLQSLSAADLADALHRSGIRWRVIIISACYAGGFIDSLRDPRTIVITAAAADRSSFGCSSDSDLTYFGEAFYRDALLRPGSLRAAFEAAKMAIAARERSEHVTPSNPQAYFGADIETKLGGLENRAR